MNTYWFNKLIEVLSVQTNSENEKLMVLYLDKELKKLKLNYSIDAAGNILVTKGKTNTYPCVVSHMDTVHDFVSNFKVYQDTDDKDILFALNGKLRVGVGGDDKCGVFGCLYLLKTIPQIKVVFFSREEVGCKGSMAINKRFFADCRYLIQLDRRGSKDFIQTFWGKKTISHEFSSEIGLVKKKYKYKNTTGTVTDVMRLWNNRVGISCINLSCGYYNPHANHEYVSISDLWHSIKFTEEIINTMKPKRYASLPPPPTVVKASDNYGGSSRCSKCKVWKQDNLLYSFWNSKINRTEKVCWPCKKKMYEPSKQSDNININNAILLACAECGVKASEMKQGETLQTINGELYCNDCAALFSVTSKEKSPEKCWVCEGIIPKDHKIIHRYGMPVCEDCAMPGDTEYVGVV